jgi:exopolysaccharide biosynthesis polyprenyl glycosylphosphotransferase
MLRLFSFKRIAATATIDWLGTLAMLLVAVWIRTGALTFPLPAFTWPVAYVQLPVFLLVALIWPFFLAVFGAYDGRRNASLMAELLNVLLAVGVATLTLAGALFLTYRGTSRLLIFTFLLLDLGLLLGTRLVLWLQRLRYRGQPHPHRRQVLVIGAGQVGRTVVEQLRRHAWADVNLVGFVDDDRDKWGQAVGRLPVLGGLDTLPALVSQHQISDAVVALPLHAHERLVEICQALQRQAVRVHVIPDLFALSFPSATLDGFGGIPVISLGQSGIYGWRRFWKRAFDVVAATLGLVIISPLLILIAAAIKLESRGPVFYRQARVGENGHPFTMLKFRSMQANADTSLHQAHATRLIQENLSAADLGEGDSLKLERDPRVTRVGAVLRKTSLDELPQLLNVLRGEMSLVGPRPPIAYEVALYQDWHKRRLAAPPGMTGLWQVRGRNRVSFDEMVRMDIEYIEQQSLWLDLQLLIQTPYAVITGRGAG